MFGVFVPPSAAQSGQRQIDEPAANPARPTVSNPATLTPVGYLQFETGFLSATDSPEFSTRHEWNEVIKLAVSRRLEFVESSEPLIHYTAEGITANGTAEVFLGAQVVLLPGEAVKPTLAVSYSRRAYDGGAHELDFDSPRNSSVFYESADVKGFHYDSNVVFDEVIQKFSAQAPVRPDAFHLTSNRERLCGVGRDLALYAALFAQQCSG
jgi:hypothetical protein